MFGVHIMIIKTIPTLPVFEDDVTQTNILFCPHITLLRVFKQSLH